MEEPLPGRLIEEGVLAEPALEARGLAFGWGVFHVRLPFLPRHLRRAALLAVPSLGIRPARLMPSSLSRHLRTVEQDAENPPNPLSPARMSTELQPFPFAWSRRHFILRVVFLGAFLGCPEWGLWLLLSAREESVPPYLFLRLQKLVLLALQQARAFLMLQPDSAALLTERSLVSGS